MKRTLITLILCLASAAVRAAVGGAVPDPVKVLPILDVEMRGPAICRAADGYYYLTGMTPGGVSLWRSKDMKTWDALGRVWPEEVLSSELHHIKGTFYIPYAQANKICGLLRSKTGRAEGPYEDLGRITPAGSSPSLFADDDGAVYWVMDEGWIARMKDDLTGLAERPRLILAKPEPTIGTSPQYVGRRGAFLFKRKGVYCLTAADWSGRTGYPVDDTFVATATNVYGPYDYRFLMVAHGGETTVFDDGKDNWFCTMAGTDVRAAFHHRPVIVPLTWTKNALRFNGKVGREFPWKAQHIITERGCWAEMRPFSDHHFRDPWFTTRANSEGYIFASGSLTDDRDAEKLILYRFKAADTADIGRGAKKPEQKTVLTFEQLPWLDVENRRKLGINEWGKPGLTPFFMDAKPFIMNGRLYVSFALYDIKGKPQTLDSGKTFISGSCMIRSANDTWDGPWEILDRTELYHFFSPEPGPDGRYYHRGAPLPEPFPGPMQKFERRKPLHLPTMPVDGAAVSTEGWAGGDLRYCPLFGNWHLTGGPTAGPTVPFNIVMYTTSYDESHAWSESGERDGPYPRPHIIPHVGSGNYFFDDRGRCWHSYFGDDDTGPWFCRLGIVPLKVEKHGRQIHLDIADEWPKD